jgi:hypothetical protein
MPFFSFPSFLYLIIIVLCALGLIIALVAPWVHLETDYDGEQMEGSYDGKLQQIESGSDEDAPDNLEDVLASEGFPDTGKYYDRGYAVAGFIWLIILVGAVIFLQAIHVFSPRNLRLIQLLITAVGLIPATLVTVAGMRFIGGFSIATPSLFKGEEVDVTFLPVAAWVVMAIGLVMFLLIIVMLNTMLRGGQAPQPAAGREALDPWFEANIRRLMVATMFLCVIGLIMTPLVPWTHITPDSEDAEDYYLDAGLIRSRADRFGGEFGDLDTDIGYINAFFWLGLLFSFVILAGLVVHRSYGRPTIGKSMLLGGAMFAIFPILSLLAHVTFGGHLKDLEMTMTETAVTFTNFATPTVVIILLFVSLVLLGGVARYIREMYVAKRMRPEQKIGEEG